MSLFWKPKGMPVILSQLQDGQHVEGYWKDRWGGAFWHRMPHATIRVTKENSSLGNYRDKTIYIMIPGQLEKKRIGYFIGNTFCEDNSYQLRLYNGLRYVKSKRRRFP